MEVSFYLKRSKAVEPTAIFASISYDGLRVKYYISEKINPKHWNKNTNRGKAIKEFREHPEFNARLDKISSEIKTIYRRYLNTNNDNIPSPDTLRRLIDQEIKKKVIEPEKVISFFEFYQDFIDRSLSGKRVNPRTKTTIAKSTMKSHTTSLKHLKEYQKINPKLVIDFATIDMDFYNNYYLDHLTQKLKLAINTVGNHIKNMKTVLNDGFELKINKYMHHKSKNFIKLNEAAFSIYLSNADLNEIQALDLTKNAKLDRVRDRLLLGCYTGLRFSDAASLKPAHIIGERIVIEQTKTGNPVVIPIHETVKAILIKYDGILPKLSNQKTNEYLKELGEMVKSLNVIVEKRITIAGIKKIVTVAKWQLLVSHTFRRTFATNAYLDKVPTITIMAITGHRTEVDFMKYIKLTPQEHADVFEAHMNKVHQLKAV